MKTIYTYLFFVFFLILLNGCKKIYEPDGLESDKKIVVINGCLDDFSDYLSVSVFYASPFDQSKNIAIDATVYLKNNKGNSYPLTKNGKGYYKIELDALALSNNAEYYISVKTSDGKEYQSTPQALPGEIEISDMEAKIGENIIDYTNSYGDILTTTLPGLFLFESAKSKDNNKKYIRFENTAIYQSLYYVSHPVEQTTTSHYCVEIVKMNTLPIIQPTLSDSEMVDKKDIGFVDCQFDYSTQHGDTSVTMPKGWVIISDAYSMSEETYNYYKKIETQLTADDKIFDPQPSQIIGNIYCTSDPDEIVLGNFEISRHVRKYFAFFWSLQTEHYEKRSLDTYIAPTVSRCDTVLVYDFIER